MLRPVSKNLDPNQPKSRRTSSFLVIERQSKESDDSSADIRSRLYCYAGASTLSKRNQPAKIQRSTRHEIIRYVDLKRIRVLIQLPPDMDIRLLIWIFLKNYVQYSSTYLGAAHEQTTICPVDNALLVTQLPVKGHAWSVMGWSVCSSLARFPFTFLLAARNTSSVFVDSFMLLNTLPIYLTEMNGRFDNPRSSAQGYVSFCLSISSCFNN
jgi:hypothetical protein